MIKNLIRENLKNFNSYETICDAGKIYLNANENPYLISDDFSLPYNRYPEPQPAELKHILATLYASEEEKIVITSGADQAIDLLIRCFINDNDKVIITPPTFSMYEFYTEVQGGKVVKVPLDEKRDYQLDINGILAKQKETKAKIVFIVNPSAPLGHEIKKDDILHLVKSLHDKAVVVVDEAYIEFSEVESFITHIKDFDNLVVLRTLSKYYGFAGLRLGALIASEDVAEKIKAIMAPYSLSMPAIEIARKILSSEEMLLKAKENKEKIMASKADLENQITSFDFVKKVFATNTNFIFFVVDDADDFKRHCYENDVVVRSFASQFKGGIRLSVGNDEENEYFLKVMAKYK